MNQNNKIFHSQKIVNMAASDFLKLKIHKNTSIESSGLNFTLNQS